MVIGLNFILFPNTRNGTTRALNVKTIIKLQMNKSNYKFVKSKIRSAIGLLIEL